jgi:hypothetical protein
MSIATQPYCIINLINLFQNKVNKLNFTLVKKLYTSFLSQLLLTQVNSIWTKVTDEKILSMGKFFPEGLKAKFRIFIGTKD